MPREACNQGTLDLTALDGLRAGLERAPVKAAIFTIAMGIVLAPLAVVLVPPLVDLPNHLAKMYLAVNLPTNEHLAEFYEWRLRFVPNLAQDFFLPTLTKIFGVYDAGRMFLAWSLIQLFLGVCLLRYAIYGRVGYWPLLAIIFLYNRVFWWGFVNYLFSSGLVLIFFAVWILMARRNPVIRSAVFSLILSMMFFFHLIATAVLSLCIATYEAGLIWLDRDRSTGLREQLPALFKKNLVNIIPFLPLLILWSISPTGANEVPFKHDGILNFLDSILSPFMLKGTQLDAMFGVSVLCFAIAAFALRLIVLKPQLVLPSLALLAVSLLMPANVLGIFGTHFRVPYVLGCIVVAGVRVAQPRKLFTIVALSLITALFIVRSAFLVSEWRQFDAQLQQYRNAIATIEPGSRVVTALDRAESENWWTSTISTRQFWHLSALVVIDASAFDPLLFSSPVRQSVAVHGDAQRLDMMVGQPAPTLWISEIYKRAVSPDRKHASLPWPERYWAEWSTWYKDFDYLIRFSLGVPRETVAGPLTLVRSGDWFDLYKIRRTEAKTP